MRQGHRQVERFADGMALAERAASIVASAAEEAVGRKGAFDLVVAGGLTPHPLYRMLSRSPWREMVPWSSTRVFWSDERCVPPGDPHSNHLSVRAALLDAVPVLPSRTFPIPAALGAEEGARRYEETLRGCFPGGALPDFDLVLLAMGADGHTASLYYGDPALKEKKRWVVPVTRMWGSPAVHRVTLSLPALSAGRTALMLVTGAGRRKSLEKAVGCASGDGLAPAGRVTARGAPARWLTAVEGKG